MESGPTGVVLHLFVATTLWVFLGTISRTMAQFALLIILVIMVLQLLSGGTAPVESQSRWWPQCPMVTIPDG